MKTRSLGQTFSWIILIALIVAGFSVVRVAAAVGPDPSPSDPASAGVWSALGAGTNGDVHTIVIDGSDVYVGGAFTSAGNCNSSAGCNNIARWDGSKWHPLGTGTNDEVDTIAISGSDVYVGGNFTSAGSCNSCHKSGGAAPAIHLP